MTAHTAHTALTRPGSSSDLLTQLAAAECDAIIRLALGDDVPHAQRVAVLNAIRAARRQSITWSEMDGLHVIDAPGRHVRIYSDLSGLAAARAALASAGQRSARAADFALPGAKYPDVAVRAALTRAAAFLRPLCETLADAVDSIRVLDGCLAFKANGLADIVIEGLKTDYVSGGLQQCRTGDDELM
jgi:hypothetical protein